MVGKILRPTSGRNGPRPITNRSEQNVPYRYIRPMGVSDRFITHRMYLPDGTEKWHADHRSTVYGLAVDASGNIYTCGGEIGVAPFPRPANYQKQYRLAKWTPGGNLIWRIDNSVATETSPGSGISLKVRGFDVSVDSAGNVWLAIGTALEKYSSSGTLLLSRGYTTAPATVIDGLFVTPSATNIQRVKAIGSVVYFGSSVVQFDNRGSGTIFFPDKRLGGQSCDLSGNDVGFFMPAVPKHFRGDSGEIFYQDVPTKYAADSSGNLYQAAYNSVTTRPAGLRDFGFTLETGHSLSLLARSSSIPPETYHLGIGSAKAITAAMSYSSPSNLPGVGAIAVHQPSGQVLYSFGPNGRGTIRNAGVIIPDVAAPYLETQPDLVTETNAGAHQMISVNDNFRYVYATLNEQVVAPGTITHRVRENPGTLVFEASHNGIVRAGLMLSNDRAVIGGDRVPI